MIDRDTTGGGVVIPFALRVTGGSGTAIDVRVRSLRGREELSRPFRFDVSGMVPEDATGTAELLGGSAAITLIGDRGLLRVVRGIVSSVRGSSRGGRSAVRLRIVPRLWVLSRGKNSRVFQDMTVPDIVRSVLGNIDCEIRTSREYAARTYCVQYQESDLSFIQRIAAEEGMFYFFRQPSASDGGNEVLVFGDTASHYDPIAGVTKLPVQLGGALTATEHVREFAFDERIRPGSTLRRGYDYQRPNYEVRGAASVAPRGAIDETTRQSYRHDGDVNEGIDDGGAARLLDAVRRRSATGEGSSTCMALTAGATFEIDGHPVDAMNTGFVLVSVEHEGSLAVDGQESGGGARYENRFTCLPSLSVFRPRATLRRLQQVAETALVVGPPGEEIWVDPQGRVKVQFPWDLQGKDDDHSSCWIRTMQPWSGTSWGFQFIPRVGMEVVVVFLAGDVDRPMIAGAVNNGVNPFPYALPGSKTQSGIRTRSSPGGAGFNELLFEDAAGAEQVYLHAQRNMDEMVEVDHTRTVRHDETITVGADRAVNIGGCQKRMVAANDDLSIGQSRTMEVVGDHVRVINGNEVVEIGKDLIIHVKGKQIINVDGQSSSPSPPAPPSSAAAPAGDDASALSAAASPSPQQVVDAAVLLWSAEQLPDDLYPEGAALSELAQNLEPVVSMLQREASGLLLLLRPAGAKLASRLAGAADSMMERAAAMKKGIQDGVTHAAGGNPALAPVQKAFAKVASGLIDRIEKAESTGKMAQSIAREVAARGWTGEGSALGGGGANPTWKPGPDGVGAALTINGGGLIDAPGGLVINCNGSQIIFKDGSIEITTKELKLTGSNTVDIESGAGTFHSDNLLKLDAPIITLN